ncbi:hypothetical protein BJ878DRAFT_312470 [Calycina marina]|uniref:IPT/TIG domain-containing protein n=1 Tax=Calycina marina TaxID=1763456 RepID=A0A9P7Z752_9HELO|nr:hypothetical protein BJ878DRAFT_312470 [Calycina marina]
MPNRKETTYIASSPFVLEPDMTGQLGNEPDLEFVAYSGLSPEEEIDPGQFYHDDLLGSSEFIDGFQSTIAAKAPLSQTLSRQDPAAHLSPSTATSSPAGSYHDSSSESSGYKRKSSSGSCQSALTSRDPMLQDEMEGWKSEETVMGTESMGFGSYGETFNPAVIQTDTAFEFNDKSMDDDFDFESAVSSPNHIVPITAEIGSPTIFMKHENTETKSPKPKNRVRTHNKANSQHSMAQSIKGLRTNISREPSPLSTGMAQSQTSSPSLYFNSSPSPRTTLEYVSETMMNDVHPSAATNWNPSVAHPSNSNPLAQYGYPAHNVQMVAQSQGYGITNRHQERRLTIHPTPLKSRVETQIPIKLTLYPMPPGITKLHLPAHTISKPKLLAKPSFRRSPDTLELYTTLVCTSAMQKPDIKKRAFERAASGSPASSPAPSTAEGAEDDDESKPLNGGEVKICQGCITRERKRAARKKVKKAEEEDSWLKDEAKRVVVFNTHEIKEWQAPTNQPESDAVGDRTEPHVPYGAMQVDAPMRIACYCRHQNEKQGFQVIFTVKDFQDHVVAQGLTESIMITDDHKTHNVPAALTTQTSSCPENPVPTASIPFSNDGGSEVPASISNFSFSQSSSDLQSLHRGSKLPNQPQQNIPTSSQATSVAMTPRNLSRQASPTAFSGPISKKRKASGSSKVPNTLAMTKLESPNTQFGIPSAPVSAAASAAPSPFTPNLTTFNMPVDQQFVHQPPMMNVAPFNTGPPTPNSNDQFFTNANRTQSMDNLGILPQMYSVANSEQPSRAPSPNSFRNVQAYQQHQAQFQTSFAPSMGPMYNIPLQFNLNPPRPSPTIHKLIPGEGPISGGIEVTCLGSGFCQGLEVMFGDCKATTTTFWGETSLVCLLPPSRQDGIVPVTFKPQNQQQQMQFLSQAQDAQKRPVHFKYVDDNEQQLMRSALAVLGHKMNGRIEDVSDIARRIIGDQASGWGSGNGATNNGGSGGPTGFNPATFGLGVDVETTLLKCLDLIDLDDSPHVARLNLRRASGQTMLHLACSLGFQRFAAALLARGANCEPRDKGGFTPMHFAALHGHAQIVRRLMLAGADPMIRSLQGYTPSDMTSSQEVINVARRIERHQRIRSASSLKSHTNSATSLRSLWEPFTYPTPGDDSQELRGGIQHSEEANVVEDGDEDADLTQDEEVFWMRSKKRASAQNSRRQSAAVEGDRDTVPTIELPPNLQIAAGLTSPAATILAFRDHLAAQVHQFQQTMQITLPNFPNLPQMNLPQMPNFGTMPTLPDYQAYLPTATPMVRRISNIVGNNRRENAREQDYKWTDLFTRAAPAPPAYDEIYPLGDAETKQASVAVAAADTADAIADSKCATFFDHTETTGVNISTTSQAESPKTAESVNKKTALLEKVTIGKKHVITREQQDRLRLDHAEKMKRLSRDRNLYFVWIPILVILTLAVLYNKVPQVWSHASSFITSIRARAEQARTRML